MSSSEGYQYDHYNILQNNGSSAHQAVFHVHFHIIPKVEEQGLGIGWRPGKLGEEQAEALKASIRAGLGEG